MTVKKYWRAIRNFFANDLILSPLKLTIVQTAGATILASALAILAFHTVGVYYAGAWYQLGVTLFVCSFVAPIFLYPSYRTAQRLQRANAIIHTQATTDHLTGLPNMLALNSKLEELLAQQQGNPFALHFMDIDRFKQVNDSLGHDAGNELLVETSLRLQSFVGNAGYVARFGGDEFVVIQFATSTQFAASMFATELRVQLGTPFKLANQELDVTLSIGTALYPSQGSNQDQLLKAADLALYKAKETRDANCTFEPNLAQSSSDHRRIENIVRDTIKTGTLKPFFHSIVQAKNPFRIVGFEALSRIQMPDGEFLHPDKFIPIAENTGLIVEIGDYILRRACMECTTWHPDLFVSVNVSPVQLTQTDFVKTVKSALNLSGLAPYRLELEITESVLINDMDHIRATLAQVRALGVHIALDDFGAGYCGLRYLRQIEVDKIKLDKSMIVGCSTSKLSKSILSGISLVAKQMHITLVAEGVDEVATAEFLALEQEIHQFQGYLFSKPVDAQEARRMQHFLPHPTAKNNVIHLPPRAREGA